MRSYSKLTGKLKTVADSQLMTKRQEIKNTQIYPNLIEYTDLSEKQNSFYNTTSHQELHLISS